MLKEAREGGSHRDQLGALADRAMAWTGGGSGNRERSQVWEVLGEKQPGTCSSTKRAK